MGSYVKEYIDSKINVPFSWGSNNCLSFVIEYLNGTGFKELPLAWFVGHPDAKSCYRAYKKHARELRYKDIVEAFDDLLYPEITLYPRDGFVVVKPYGDLIGYSCSVHYGGYNYFLDELGLTRQEPEPKDLYWSIPA